MAAEQPLQEAAALHAVGRTFAARALLPCAEELASAPEADRALAAEICSVADAAAAALRELDADEADAGWSCALDGGGANGLRALYKHVAGTTVHDLKLEVRRRARSGRARGAAQKRVAAARAS